MGNEDEGEVFMQSQVVLMEPSLFFNQETVNILNISAGAITCDCELEQVVSQLFKTQATNSEKYADLVSKTIYLVSREEFEMIVDFYQGVSASKEKDTGVKKEEANFEQDFI